MTEPTRNSEQVSLSELLAAMRRVAALPKPPKDEDPDWAEKVINGEAPYGRCAYCGAARGPMTCLNLCELPSGHARAITDGLRATLGEMRGKIRFLEALSGCTCPPARLSGYEIERQSHEPGCKRGRWLE